MSKSKGRKDEAYVKATDKILHKFAYFIATLDGNQSMERQSYFV